MAEVLFRNALTMPKKHVLDNTLLLSSIAYKISKVALNPNTRPRCSLLSYEGKWSSLPILFII